MPKLTSIVWRAMGEGVLLSLALFAVIALSMQGFHLLRPTDWETGIRFTATALGLVMITGAAYGFWHSHRINSRLEALRASMLFMEKGNFSRPIPDLGEDEIGRLAEQLGRITSKWEEQVTSLQRLSTNNAELAEKARYSAIVEERQRLARDLHDAVSQQLFAISMTATALGRTLEKDMERAKRQVSLIEEMSSVAQSEMRALLLHLRPVHLEGKRFTDALRELLQELTAKMPIHIQWEMDDDVRLAKGVEDQLFRIVQEALSNTLRHSRADRLEMKLYRRVDGVRLSIRDNGIGFEMDQKKQASYGLMSMAERVNEIGGFINIVSAPGKGTKIEIRVPVMLEGEEEHVGESIVSG
ncbi:sensor histidine kinase [Paenibacillus thermotolerans]|uniref:sensor histidine kinase n=1 Tax=Paenibacillus thermotolerans TaxID=3027807 RepID=UPI002368D5F7|nr:MULTISPECIES: sensor histidine kinase [unclassified Paenibacillus]